MAKPLDNAAFKGGNKSLTLLGQTFPVGPQIALAAGLKPFSAIGLPVNGTAALVQAAGKVIDGFDLRGHDLVIQADNVTVRNCLFNAIAFHTLNNQAGKRGLVVEFNMFDGEKANNGNSDAVYTEAPDTIVRNNVFLNLPSDAVNMPGGQMVRNAFSGACYATGAHADGVSVHKTFVSMLIKENYIDFRKMPDSTQGPNSCTKIVSHFGTINDVLIDRNILIGGGFNAYVGDGGKGVPSNVRLTNNLMGLTEYGDKAEQFVFPGDHGPGFAMAGNSLFSAAPDGVVAVGGAVPAPAPAPVPAPAPTPAPDPAPVVDAALRKAVNDAAATLENLAYSLRQLAK